MLNNNQIKLVQIAVKTAGIRGKGFEGRYRMLLGQYKQPNGSPVESCKQLNNEQLDDVLAICESLGWRQPGLSENHYRAKVKKKCNAHASFAQQSAIGHLRGDLGWSCEDLRGFIEKMFKGSGKISPCELFPGEAYKVIEGLKAILARQDGKDYTYLEDVATEYCEKTEIEESKIENQKSKMEGEVTDDANIKQEIPF